MDDVPIRLDQGAVRQMPGLFAGAIVVRRDRGRTPEPLPSAAVVVPDVWTLDGLKDVDVAAAYRRLSWKVGIDPTKNRPSGEALARRVLGGKPLPTIHPLVDAYNLASATTLVPLSAYDLGHLDPPLTIRWSTEGDRFHGIGRDDEDLGAGRLVYEDANGTIAGVFLWRDAVATRCRQTTDEALLWLVAADPVPRAAAEVALDEAARLAARAGFVAAEAPFWTP